MTSKTEYIVIVSVDSDDSSDSFGIITKKNYDLWNTGELDAESDHDDLFGVKVGSPYVTNVNGWANVTKFLEENNGVIANVEACIGY
jgi:hypothetical protein